MTLEILICTIDEGINRVADMLLPQTPGFRYLVSWQLTGKVASLVPAELRRPDVRVFTLQGKGLSRNRNNALRNASGDICLIADDDLVLLPDGLRAVATTFEQNPELDFATFRYDSESDSKTYPDHEFDLHSFPKNYFISSIEIAFRRTSVQSRLWFDEHFGLGAPVLGAGEESVWVHDALSMGMQARFFPITIATHNHPTTGIRCVTNPAVVMANGAYLYIAKRHDHMLLRALLMAWRVSRNGDVSLPKALNWVMKGIDYAKSLPRPARPAQP